MKQNISRGEFKEKLSLLQAAKNSAAIQGLPPKQDIESNAEFIERIRLANVPSIL